MKKFCVRRGAYWMVTSLFLAVAGCGGDSGTNGGNGNGSGTGNGNGSGTTPVATTSVTVSDNFFTPPDIVVSGGATVTWTWAGNVGHNVTFSSSQITSQPTQTTGTHSAVMPTAAGVYAYQCTIHPSTMQASVTVE